MENIDFFYALFVFILGLLFGSFANVIILRLPAGLSVVTPRSHCGACKKTIPWHDNVPFFSWFILRGKCRFCKTPFSVRYALVEMLMGLAFLAVFLKVGPSWLLLEYLVFVFGLITVSFIDLDHMILPDEFTLSGIGLGLAGAFLNPEREFLEAVWGVLLGGGFLWAIAVIYQAIRKQEGMGGGDIKLLAWMGALLGWSSIPFIILTSSLLGTLVGLVQMRKAGGGLATAIPFGPFLALAGFIYLLAGEEITQAYIGLFIPSLSPVH